MLGDVIITGAVELTAYFAVKSFILLQTRLPLWHTKSLFLFLQADNIQNFPLNFKFLNCSIGIIKRILSLELIVAYPLGYQPF